MDDVSRDPDPGWGAVPWGMGALGLALLVAGFALQWLAGQTSGVRHVLLVIATAVTLLLGAYYLLMVIGWALLNWLIIVAGRRRVRREASRGRAVIYLRAPMDGEHEPQWASVLWERLEGDGEVELGSLSMGTDEPLSMSLTGTSAHAAIGRLRMALVGLTLPAGAYVWVPEPAGNGRGRRHVP